MPIKQIFIFGHGGAYNRGCEAILRTTTGLINSTFKNTKCIVASVRKHEDEEITYDNVEEFISYHYFKKWTFGWFTSMLINRLINNYRIKGKLILRILYPRIYSSIKNSYICISIGGDNYCYGRPIKYFYIDSVAKALNKKTILFGASIEPDLMNEYTAKDLSTFDLIIVRETITYEALLKKGINKNISLYPDPAFTLATIKLPFPKGFNEKNTIGINVSPLIMKYEKIKGMAFKNFKKLLQYIIDTTNMQIALIPHVIISNNNDLDVLKDLYELYKNTNRIFLIGDKYNAMEIKGFISRCRIFIGARTHSTISAYSSCIPTLVVGYSVKARGIARDIFGTEKNYVIPVQSLEHENDLVNAFKYIQENEETIKKHLQDFMPSYIEKAWQAGEEVKKLLEN